MLCLVYVVIYHALFAGILIGGHLQTHGALNLTQLILAVFSAINAWICVCEIALLVHSGAIRREYEGFNAKLGVGRLPPIFLFEHASLSQIFSLRYWAVMWSTYSVLDPSYSDTTTFGFCVDVGNGVTTLLPTLLYAAGMTWQVLPARLMGAMGIAVFWQEFYGTVMYFFQYVFNRRFDRSPRAHVFGIVVPANALCWKMPAGRFGQNACLQALPASSTAPGRPDVRTAPGRRAAWDACPVPAGALLPTQANGIWLACPALGMWASYQLIVRGDFSVFGQSTV